MTIAAKTTVFKTSPTHVKLVAFSAPMCLTTLPTDNVRIAVELGDAAEAAPSGLNVRKLPFREVSPTREGDRSEAPDDGL